MRPGEEPGEIEEMQGEGWILQKIRDDKHLANDFRILQRVRKSIEDNLTSLRL